MASNSSPQNPLPSGQLAERLIFLAVLLLVGGLALQWGLQRGAESARRPASEDFYPRWAATAPYNRPLWVRDTDSALGRLNLRPKQLALKDLARFHGHLCDGLVVSWVELSAALGVLFPEGIVDRTDLRVVSKNGPCWADAATAMTGARANHGTLALDSGVGDAFVVQRISTGEAVHVSLRAGVFPADLAELEGSIRTRRARGEEIRPEEIDRFEALSAEFSRRLLNLPPESVVQVESLTNFVFPAYSPNPVVPRGDVLNRDLGRTERQHGGGQP